MQETKTSNGMTCQRLQTYILGPAFNTAYSLSGTVYRAGQLLMCLESTHVWRRIAFPCISFKAYVGSSRGFSTQRTPCQFCVYNASLMLQHVQHFYNLSYGALTYSCSCRIFIYSAYCCCAASSLLLCVMCGGIPFLLLLQPMYITYANSMLTQFSHHQQQFVVVRRFVCCYRIVFFCNKKNGELIKTRRMTCDWCRWKRAQ